MAHLMQERGLDVVAYEYVPDDTAATRQLERFPEITVHVGRDPVALPFDDASFDAVLGCGVLEHVERPVESLAELRRVLRRGGRLFVYKLPNRFSYLEAIARRTGMYYHGALPDDRVYTRRSAVALVAESGFRIDAFRRTNMLPLTVEHPLVWRASGALWSMNRALARVPGLSLLATNLELETTAS
jgi:SAM-dependent methyltransferase